MTARPCRYCGELIAAGSWCIECDPGHRGKPAGTPKERGYDTQWRRLSERARRIQPYCTDCGTTDDLTGDHSREAWRRKDAGLPIRLRDIDVVCRSCNSKRGQQRPGGSPPHTALPTCAGEAKTRSHTGMIPEKEVQDHARRPEGDAGQQPAAIPPTQ